MSPFEFLNAINFTKKNVMSDPENEKYYNSFIINRSLVRICAWAQLLNKINVI